MPEQLQDPITNSLRGAYMALHRVAQERFSKAGATANQYVTLTVLTEEDGLTQVQVGRRIGSDPNTVAAMIARLERKGAVRRHADGRARRVHLTAKGRQLQQRLSQTADELHRLLHSALSDAEQQSLQCCLAKTSKALSTAQGE